MVLAMVAVAVVTEEHAKIIFRIDKLWTNSVAAQVGQHPHDFHSKELNNIKEKRIKSKRTTKAACYKKRSRYQY